MLSEWVAQLGERDPHVRTAWLSLDDGDNDLTRLLTHLVASLGTVGVELEPAAVLEHLPADATAALTALVNAVARGRSTRTRGAVGPRPGRLPRHHRSRRARGDDVPPRPPARPAAPDDRHPRRPAAARGAAAQPWAARRGPRRRPPLHRGEAQQFLNQAMGLDLDAADVDALEERTEGWIAGLQLAALSLRAIPTRPEVVDFIEAFTGSNRFVIDYLADEVLARQPTGVRDFLLRTAVLDRLTGPLCDAVSGQHRRRRDAGGPRSRQPVRRPAGHRALLVPLPPPVRRRAARTPAHRGPRPGPAAAPAGQRLVRRTRPGRGRGPARPGRRGLHSGRLSDGGSAARGSSRATGQPAAQLGPGTAAVRRPSKSGAEHRGRLGTDADR